MTAKEHIQPLCEVATVRLGYPFRGRIHFEPDGRIPVVQLRNFDAAHQPNEAPLLCVKHLPDAERHALRAGDVLYAAKGGRNFAFAVAGEFEGAVPASYFFVLHPRTASVLSEYLGWYINQSAARAFLHSRARQGTHMPVISKSVFETLPVPVPPLAIQRAVVALDGLRRQEQVLQQQLNEMESRMIAAVSLRSVSKWSGVATH